MAPPALEDRPLGQQMVVTMVGLPARGKTFTARKLARFLTWRGHRARVFNLGEYRRAHMGGARVGAAFFSDDNPEGAAVRERAFVTALRDLHDWLREGGEVAIVDATNSVRSRRERIRDACEAIGVPTMFVECVVHDRAIVEANIRDTKPQSPDYAGMDPVDAIRDFKQRLRHYEATYETIDDESMSYIKLIDLGRRVEVNRIKGFLGLRIVNFLMNLRAFPKTIWLTRHGESEDNVRELLGGDSPLTARGQEYARELREFLDERAPDITAVWTSTLKRALQTTSALGRRFESLKALDEIEAGVCDGLTYAQVAERMPEEFALRKADKLRYRYPRGESYEDVIHRVEPVIIEMERQPTPVVIVAHQAILRTLYAYLTGRPRTECPHIEMPIHTVIELRPGSYGVAEQRYRLLSEQ